jgi:mevalonate kinase
VSPAAAALTAFGPGKVILLGEHGVVYGHPALAAPLSRGVHAVATPARAPRLVVPASLAPAQAAALRRAFLVAAAQAGSPGVLVRLTSDLPISMGLGSSGALSVAVSRVLLEAGTGRAPRPKEVERLAFRMEGEFHGTPSGVDHTTSARNALILFRRGRAVEVVARRPIKVLVALVGPRASTRSTVAALRARQARWPGRYRRLFGEVGTLVLEGAAAARRGDLEALGDVMNLNQGLLASLGLSSERIEAMVYRLRGLGALGAKLTGAGGDGGAVLGLFPEPQRALLRLRRAGVACFESQLGGPRAL